MLRTCGFSSWWDHSRPPRKNKPSATKTTVATVTATPESSAAVCVSNQETGSSAVGSGISQFFDSSTADSFRSVFSVSVSVSKNT